MRRRLLILAMILAFGQLASAAVAMPLKQEGTAYTVQVDDTLWRLAERYLGDGHRYPEIAAATNARHNEDASFALIADPALIQPGWRLWIPAEEAVGPVPVPTPTVTPVAGPAAVGGELSGQIAFSFFNIGRLRYEIQVFKVDGSDWRIVTTDDVSEPALSPDGTHVAFRMWGPDRGLAVSDVFGGNRHILTSFYEDVLPDWAPDGQRLVFASQRWEDRRWRIYLVGADGSWEWEFGTRENPIYGEKPAWAPDGRRIVFRSWDRTANNPGLYTINDDGSEWTRLTDNPSDTAPDWSPLGDPIVFTSQRDGNWDVYAINADGSGLRRLTNDPANDGLPAWSPDGQHVAFVSDRGGRWALYAMDSDGDNVRLLRELPGDYAPPSRDPHGQRNWLDERISWSN